MIILLSELETVVLGLWVVEIHMEPEGLSGTNKLAVSRMQVSFEMKHFETRSMGVMALGHRHI